MNPRTAAIAITVISAKIAKTALILIFATNVMAAAVVLAVSDLIKRSFVFLIKNIHKNNTQKKSQKPGGSAWILSLKNKMNFVKLLLIRMRM